ncbi:protein that induces appearance of [PIN+] prion when overproduced [Ciborinia camelliae]|nr:protein that induces appearance of [PIN+] prion when overproduced [Ciborinia camelliae]
MAPKSAKEKKITRGWRRLSSESSSTNKLVSEKNSDSINLKRTSTVSFGGKKSPIQQDQRRASVQLEPIVEKMNSVGEESASELGGLGGLGIKFYDHLGNKVSTQEMMAPRVPSTQSPRVPGTQKPTSPLPKDPPVAARTPLVIRESFTRNFTFPGTPEAIVDGEKLLGDLLEQTLREQSDALCPSPTSSRKNSIRIHTPKSNRQVSAAKPIVISGAFGFRNHTSPLSVPSSPALAYTPTRGPKFGVTAAHSRILSLRALNTESEVDYFNFKSKTSEENSGFTPEALKDTGSALNSKLYRIPTSPTIAKRTSRSKPQRGELYFFEHEREKIEQLVAQSKNRSCSNHQNCTDCIEKEYAYYENKIMSTSMPPERRQQIMKANRSIRNIKNELENLLEDELITYEVYELMISKLPSENSLNSTSSPAPRSNVVSPAPVVPVAAFSQLNVNNDNPPPSYQSTPNLPPRGPTQPPARPEIGRATALYRYTEPEDCNFDVGDIIIIFEYMNDDWWMGKNEKTGKEGVFPSNYVQKHTAQPAPQHSYYGNEKATHSPYAPQQQAYSPYAPQQQGPPPPGPSNPYNSSVPPMAVAEQPTEDKPSKGGEMGKKFGKKLGNAAIFGAGATIGGNIVNSIF